MFGGGGWTGFFALATGAVYDPTTDTWAPTSTVNAPSALAWHTAVWTGSKMIVWGWDVGTAYDPTTDTWTPTSTLNDPSMRERHTAVWTGSNMIVWGGYVGGGLQGDLRPTTARMPMSTTSLRRSFSHTAVWTWSKMVVWGGGRTCAQHWGIYDFSLTRGRQQARWHPPPPSRLYGRID
jgi:hypothetical protein